LTSESSGLVIRGLAVKVYVVLLGKPTTTKAGPPGGGINVIVPKELRFNLDEI
jgi:hypothetical protein